MKRSILIVALGAAVAITGMTAGATWAQDVPTSITQRQDAMKALGRALGAVRAFTEDKGDLAAARTAGAQLTQSLATIPGLFPQKTGMAEFPGKTRAKPEIWAQWDKFNDAQKAALSQAQALNTALQGGDKAAITTALGNLARDVPGATPNPGGCGGCHGPFRGPPPG
jgi:cytochrome c556